MGGQEGGFGGGGAFWAGGPKNARGCQEIFFYTLLGIGYFLHKKVVSRQNLERNVTFLMLGGSQKFLPEK